MDMDIFVKVIVPTAILVVAFLLKMPIAFSLISTSVIYFGINGIDIGMICEKMMSRLFFQYVIIAIPLFIFTANVLNSSQIADHLFKFTKACVGKKKGALAYVNCIISLIFSGMTGSAYADASGIGMIEIEAMDKDGYDKPFTAAITAATATIGPVFPPSLILVTYSMLSGASVGKLLMGGVVPGVLLCVSLMCYVGFISARRNYPTGEKYTFKEFRRLTIKAFPALLTPVILLVGIYSGIVTATEAGAVAAIYGLVISVLVYRTLNLKGIWECLKKSAEESSRILIMMASTASFSYIITVSGLGQALADWFMHLTENKYIFLAVINLLFLILGALFDTSISTYVVLPLLIPVAQAMGVDMVHFGLVFVVNIMLGMVSPPYGILCFIVSDMCHTPLKSVFKEVLPMLIPMFIVLLIVTYIPQVVLFIPTIMG